MFDLNTLNSFDTGLNELERAQEALRRVTERTCAIHEQTQQAINASAQRLYRTAAK